MEAVQPHRQAVPAKSRSASIASTFERRRSSCGFVGWRFRSGCGCVSGAVRLRRAVRASVFHAPANRNCPLLEPLFDSASNSKRQGHLDHRFHSLARLPRARLLVSACALLCLAPPVACRRRSASFAVNLYGQRVISSTPSGNGRAPRGEVSRRSTLCTGHSRLAPAIRYAVHDAELAPDGVPLAERPLNGCP